MKIDFINSSYRRYFSKHKKELVNAFIKCASRGDFILRKDVSNFEHNLAEYVGSRYCVSTNSGTDALFLSLKALGIGKDDEVIVPSHTFIACIQVIYHCGATPILIDVGEDALMDCDLLEGLITPKTKAIMLVHLSGKVCDMDRIMAIARKHKLAVIEDACQSLGAFWHDKMSGSIGDVGCFSFISPKTMGGMGDNGAITTNSKKLYEKLYLLHNHWNITQGALHGLKLKQPKIMDFGWNSRMDNIQASILAIKLKYYPAMLKRRREIGMRYYRELQNLPIKLPIIQSQQIFQEFIIRVENRTKFIKFMKKNGIELLVRDIIPNHLLKGLNLDHFKLPITEKMAKDCVRIPCYPELADLEVSAIIKTIKRYYARG